MQIVFTTKARKDLEFWTRTGNKRILNKIAELIDAIQQNPFEGIGKPEQLKYNLSGVWSRRINQ